MNITTATKDWTFPTLASGELAMVYVDMEVPKGTPVEVGFTGTSNARPEFTANAIGDGMVQVILRNNKPDGYLTLQPGTINLVAFVAESEGGA